jgi:Protein of unknown function (DUF4199)
MSDPILDDQMKAYRNFRKEVPFMKTAFQYGLILGGAGIILQLGAYLMGLDLQNPNTGLMPKIVLGLASVTLSVVIYRTTMVQHRDQMQGGFLSLGQTIKIGAIIGLASGILSGLYVMLFGTVINPNYVNELKAGMFETWEKQGLNEEAMDMAWQWTKYFVDPIVGGISQMVLGPLSGAFFGLIVGLFVKRESPNER